MCTETATSTLVLKKKPRIRNLTSVGVCTIIPKVLSEEEEIWGGEGTLPILPDLDVRRSELQNTIQKFLNKKDVSPNLNQKTIDIAKAVADRLPSFALEPDSVYPTALGDIDFEWVFSKDNMLSLEISQNGEIIHSKISKTRGTEKWNGEFPSVVSRWFEDLQVYLNKANG